MGEQSPSDSDYQAASGQLDYRRNQKAREKQKQEEAMMRMAEMEDQIGLYARSKSGNIIRSASSGRAVTSRAGRQAQENIRAGFEGRTARDMDAEFPMDTGGDDQPMQTSGQSKIEPKSQKVKGI